MPNRTALLMLGSTDRSTCPEAAPLTPSREDRPRRAEARATAHGMRLLAAGVPLTLLLDLCLPVDSSAIAAAEGGSASWLHH